MDSLRDFMDGHRRDSDADTLPEGHKDRFLARLRDTRSERQPRVLSRPWRLAAIVAASALVAGVFLLRRAEQQNPVQYEITSYNRNLDIMADDIRDICRRTGQDTLQVDKVIRNIEGEAIPLYEQLPDELSDEQKARVLKRYFNVKLNAVKQLRAAISEEE